MTTTVDSEDLVVGDLVVIENGKAIPADCILVSSIDMTTNESSLTGETEAMHKLHLTQDNYSHNPCPFVLQSTLVETGQGTAIVAAVGDLTCAGKANRALDIENELTPLQLKLETIADQIGMVGFYTAVLTFFAMLGQLLLQVYNTDSELFVMKNLSEVLDYLIIGVSIVVVAVPEGLPLAVTISLAFSVQKMFKENNLVRKLHASETMGGAHEICSDKTGTLTQNKMTVMALYISGQSTHGSQNVSLNSDKNSTLLAESVIYNSSAHVEVENGQKVAKGNVTEVGMIKYLMDSKVEVESLIHRRGQDGTFEFQIPFNSSRKRQTSAVRLTNGNVRVFLKGGPDFIIDKCSHTLDAQGKAVPLSEEQKLDLMNVTVVKQYASKCYRTLLVAYCDYTDAQW